MTTTVRGIQPGSRDASVTLGDHVEREYTAVYLVQTDDKQDGAKDVALAFGIPRVGDFYDPGNDYDPAAVVTTVDPRETDSPYEWEVAVTWSTEWGSQDRPRNQPVDQDNPLLEPPMVTYGFTNRRVPAIGRYVTPESPPADGNFDGMILAPNGEPFTPQPELELSEPTLTIRKNVASISGVQLMSLANTVNMSNFSGAAPRQLRMTGPQAQSKWHKLIGIYWTVTYQMLFRWETWDLQVLNQGSYYWNGGKPADITSTTAIRVADLKGFPLGLVNLTTGGDINKTNTPTFTRLKVYREIDFNTLGLI